MKLPAAIERWMKQKEAKDAAMDAKKRKFYDDAFAEYKKLYAMNKDTAALGRELGWNPFSQWLEAYLRDKEASTLTVYDIALDLIEEQSKFTWNQAIAWADAWNVEHPDDLISAEEFYAMTPKVAAIWAQIHTQADFDRIFYGIEDFSE